eukprot:4048246-Prymnesium_polylepis.3
MRTPFASHLDECTTIHRSASGSTIDAHILYNLSVEGERVASVLPCHQEAQRRVKRCRHRAHVRNALAHRVVCGIERDVELLGRVVHEVIATSGGAHDD